MASLQLKQNHDAKLGPMGEEYEHQELYVNVLENFRNYIYIIFVVVMPCLNLSFVIHTNISSFRSVIWETVLSPEIPVTTHVHIQMYVDSCRRGSDISCHRNNF